MAIFRPDAPFADRKDAADRLAQQLHQYADRSDVVIYALPRGGVVTGRVIADVLHAPLDLIIVRKVGHPSFPEYAIGSVAEDGHFTAEPSEVASVDQDWLASEIEAQRTEARRRRETYLRGIPPIDGYGKIAILVDDGIATGLTMRSAIDELRHLQPSKIIIAVPVAPPESLDTLRPSVDAIVCLLMPEHLGAVGEFYSAFPQVEDAEVITLMQSHS